MQNVGIKPGESTQVIKALPSTSIPVVCFFKKLNCNLAGRPRFKKKMFSCF